jgi:hypothetical protein
MAVLTGVESTFMSGKKPMPEEIKMVARPLGKAMEAVSKAGEAAGKALVLSKENPKHN